MTNKLSYRASCDYLLPETLVAMITDLETQRVAATRHADQVSRAWGESRGTRMMRDVSTTSDAILTDTIDALIANAGIDEARTMLASACATLVLNDWIEEDEDGQA